MEKVEKSLCIWVCTLWSSVVRRYVSVCFVLPVCVKKGKNPDVGTEKVIKKFVCYGIYVFDRRVICRCVSFPVVIHIYVGEFLLLAKLV